MKVAFEETQVSFTCTGQGDPLVLLHGFLESGAIWNSLLPQLIHYAQVVIIDLPGHGNSPTARKVHSMEFLAAAVYQVLSSLKIRKASFLGHSMGGYVALAFLEKFPDMVDRLLLVNSTTTPDSPERKVQRERSIRLIHKNRQAYVSMAISNLLPKKSVDRWSKELEFLKRDASAFSETGIIANLKGMKIRTDRTAVLEAFSGPKIWVAGREDPLLNYLEMKALAKKTKSAFQGVSGGHLSILEHPGFLSQLCISSKK